MSLAKFDEIWTKERRKTVWQRGLVWFFDRLSVRVQKMPRKRTVRLGTFLGNLAYRVAGKQRAYAERNLRLAGFPSFLSTPAERDTLIRRVFVHFACTMVDFLRSPSFTHAEMDRLIVTEGVEHLEAARARKKGIIILTAHLGNWELLGRWLAQHDVPLTVVARDPQDPVFARWVKEMRRNAGFEVMSKGSSARELLTRLKSNQAVGLLPDQNSGDVFVPFFGVPAGTPAGPATFALRTGAVILPSFCVRLPDNRYRVLFLSPIPAEATADKEGDVRRVTEAINQCLESVVRQYPEQWLWLHNRWKSAFEEKNHERCWTIETQGSEDAYRSAAARWEGNAE